MVASLNLNNSKSRVNDDTAFSLILYFLSNVGSVTLEALVLWFQQLGKNDVEVVGGKNASLGEMISNLANVGVSVPNGFATTAQAYRDFLEQSGLTKRINDALDGLNVDDVVRLAEVDKQIRE